MRWQRARLEEGGFVIVLFAVALSALTAAAGLAIDVGLVYLSIQRDQRALDAAALAGAVYLPHNAPAADQAAREALALNGYSGTVEQLRPLPADDTYLEVVGSNTVQTTFLRAFGHETLSYRREALATYATAIAMGSPINVLGIEPDSPAAGESWTAVPNAAHFWLSNNGPLGKKGNGDRWSVMTCPTEFNGVPDLCDSGKSPPNLEYDARGSDYLIHVQAGAAGTLALEAFDILYQPVGVDCTSSRLSYVYGKTNNPVYDPNDTALCTRDHAGSNERTTVSLYNPQLPGQSPTLVSGCPVRTYEPLVGNQNQWLAALTTVTADPSHVSNTFRKWTRICTFHVPLSTQNVSYRLNLSRDTDDVGSNHFSLRAGFLQGGVIDKTASKKVQVYAGGRLRIAAVSSSSVFDFHMAQLTSAHAGRTVRIEAFDLADVKDASGDEAPMQELRVYPSTGLTRSDGTPITSFSCVATHPVTKAKTTKNPCSSTNVTRTDYNGKIAAFDVAIPSDAKCVSVGGCFIMVKQDYGSAIVTVDHASWSASEQGRPLRLVERSQAPK